MEKTTIRKIVFVEAYPHVTVVRMNGSKIVGALAIQAHQTAGVWDIELHYPI